MISGEISALKRKDPPLMRIFVAGRGMVLASEAVGTVGAASLQERSMSDSPLRRAGPGTRVLAEIQRFRRTCDERVFHLQSHRHHRRHLKNALWRTLHVVDECWGFWGQEGVVHARPIVVFSVSWNEHCHSTVFAPSSPALQKRVR